MEDLRKMKDFQEPKARGGHTARAMKEMVMFEGAEGGVPRNDADLREMKQGNEAFDENGGSRSRSGGAGAGPETQTLDKLRKRRI